MTLFNSYYPPAEYDFRHDDRLTSFYRNYEVIADCVCDDTLQAYISRSEDPELCVPSLIILLHQMHQSILSLTEQVEYLKDPERYEYYTDSQIEQMKKDD